MGVTVYLALTVPLMSLCRMSVGLTVQQIDEKPLTGHPEISHAAGMGATVTKCHTTQTKEQAVINEHGLPLL